MEKTSGSAARPNADMMSEKSHTKKERDIKGMMEVAKLIQQATDTTNNLFENSSNFKFKIKRENIKEGGSQNPSQINNKKPLQTQNSRKNIKTNDPFKMADAKLQNTTNTVNNQSQQLQNPKSQRSNHQNEQIQDDQSHINLADSMGYNEQNQLMSQEQLNTQFKDKDDDIMSNLDKMIQNLQAQQQKCAEINPLSNNMKNQNTQLNDNQEDQVHDQFQPGRIRPVSGIPRPSSNISSRSKSNKKGGNSIYRPISAVDGNNQQQLGKYAQMAMNNQHSDNVFAHGTQQQQQFNDGKSQKSQKSLGKFAQMALNGVEGNQQVIQEVKLKYIGEQDPHTKAVMEQLQIIQQQNILRPVSGKSNSTRYANHHKSQSLSNRNKSGGRNDQQQTQQNPQYYYEDESDDYTAQIQQINQDHQLDINYDQQQQQQQHNYQSDNNNYQQNHQLYNQQQQIYNHDDEKDSNDDEGDNFQAQQEDTSRFNIGYDERDQQNEPDYE